MYYCFIKADAFLVENDICVFGGVVRNVLYTVPEDSLMSEDLHIGGAEDVIDRSAARVVFS